MILKSNCCISTHCKCWHRSILWVTCTNRCLSSIREPTWFTSSYCTQKLATIDLVTWLMGITSSWRSRIRKRSSGMCRSGGSRQQSSNSLASRFHWLARLSKKKRMRRFTLWLVLSSIMIPCPRQKSTRRTKLQVRVKLKICKKSAKK